MSGVSIVNTPAESPDQINPHVLMEILSANEAVATRIKAFQDAKTDAEKALAALKLGKDTQRAHADANQKYNEAVALNEKAQKANDEAIRTVVEAQGKAKVLVDTAKADHDRVQASIAKALAEHDAFLDRSKAEQATKQKKLDDALASVEWDKNRLATAQKAASEAQDEAKRQQALATAAEADFKAKAAKLHQALAQIAT